MMDIQDLLSNKEWGLYFHGSSAAFDEFSPELVGTGKDANSALGFFVTDIWNAARYAKLVSNGDENGIVLAVFVREAKPFEFDTYDAFYGADFPNSSYTKRGRAAFKCMRDELLLAGHDSAWFGLDDDGIIGVALAPENIIIAAKISIAQALELAYIAPFWDYVNYPDSSYKQRAFELIEVAQKLNTESRYVTACSP